MTLYNIYYGTIGKTLGCKYHFSKYCKDEQSAIKLAQDSASSLYYKYEGKYGIPSFNTVLKESEITGIDIEDLYKEHINDMMRWYAIPFEDDTISSKDIKL